MYRANLTTSAVFVSAVPKVNPRQSLCDTSTAISKSTRIRATLGRVFAIVADAVSLLRPTCRRTLTPRAQPMRATRPVQQPSAMHRSHRAVVSWRRTHEPSEQPEPLHGLQYREVRQACRWPRQMRAGGQRVCAPRWSGSRATHHTMAALARGGHFGAASGGFKFGDAS